MEEYEFAYQLFQVLNYTNRLEVATLTMDSFHVPPQVKVELHSGEKYCISVEKTDEIL